MRDANPEQDAAVAVVKGAAVKGAAAGRSAVSRIPGLLLLACSLAPLLLALAALTGVGLHQNLSTLQSLLVGLALIALPSLGLASLFGSGTAAHGWAFIAWSPNA